MAAASPPAGQTADLLQKLSIDSQTKTLEGAEPTKKFVPVENGNFANSTAKPFERSTTPMHQVDPSACYVPNGYASSPYYYGGYDAQVNEWEDYPRYINSDGVEIPPSPYGENGPLMYGYGYAPYGAYPPPGSPVPSMGHDGQLYGPQHYQYPTPYYQPPMPTSGAYTPNNQPNESGQGDVSTSVAADQAPLSVEAAKGNPKGVSNNGPKPLRPSSYQNSSLSSNGSYGRGGSVPSLGNQDPRFGFDGTRSPNSWLDAPLFSDGQTKHATNNTISYLSHANRSQNLRPLPQLMGLQQPRPTSGMGQPSTFMSTMYANNNRMYSQYGNTHYGNTQYGNAFRTNLGFGSNAYDSRISGRGWFPVDSTKYKARGRGNGLFGYGNENGDGLNELNRGPRAKGSKNQKGFGPVTLAVKGQSIPLSVGDNNDDNLSLIPNREQYNREDFPETYSDAKFFVIKSYSEDDVHKSIKYSVWASTPNGNKKLDAAYHEAQERTLSCPVFLLFSVNTSGQFVGLAEMVGPLDFNKSLDYWQQDKWTGCFPVKWHIVKDVPNSLLKHITLENNENKPVTNSRDTQEVRLEQGLQIIKIFKGHSSKSSLLDDFGFYEARQSTMQEKKAKQQHLYKQALELKPINLVASDGKDKDGSVTTALVKEPLVGGVRDDGEMKLLQENGLGAGTEDGSKGGKPVLVAEKRAFPSGVANAC